jgi:cytochrome P450
MPRVVCDARREPRARDSVEERMSHPEQDWDPASGEAVKNQIALYDRVRRRCPVARSNPLHWSFLAHADVMRALLDPETYSNAVSEHPAVPNGMDPPEHTRFRALIDPYFGPEAMAAFEPVCRRIAEGLAARLPRAGDIDLMAVAEDFALQAQCAFMGWPESLHATLKQWTRRNAAATRARDRQATAAVAREFDNLVGELLKVRRDAGDAAPDDATTRLMRERVEGLPLADPEIVSIVRNWTVGELGTIAASVGIVIHLLAERTELQDRLRAEPAALPAAIDEILRIHPPLIANRRITTRPVEVGGRHIGARERITLIWASANRDEAVFGDPDAFDPERNRARNLLWGAGIHVCPGAPLARLELRLVVEALLARLRFRPLADKPPVRAIYPGAGFTSLPLRIEPADSA